MKKDRVRSLLRGFMVKGIPNGVNPEDSFSHRYAGGVNQYGTKGAESPDQFQGYMNDGMTQQNPANSVQSPMNLMSTKAQPTFGPPPSTQPSMVQGAAPENFGPPQINKTDADNTSQFGAPGFNNKGGTSQKLAGENDSSTSQLGNPPRGNKGAKPKVADSKAKTEASEDSKKDTPSYQKVEKMMTEQMIQGAIARMKIKDPDPGVWKQS